MALFNLVVAAALITSGVSGLGTFKIPMGLLALVRLSQVIFIGGKPANTARYEELDAKLDETRRHEAKYPEFVA